MKIWWIRCRLRPEKISPVASLPRRIGTAWCLPVPNIRVVMQWILVPWFVLSCGLAYSQPIRIISRGDDNASYAIQMIQLGLEKAGLSTELDIVNDALSAPKLREELLAGTVDIIWTATNNDMEEQALPIRVPLFKGLLGHRILIVQQENEHLFDHVETLEQAKRYKYGQGKGWTDTTILQYNGINVVTAIKYESLFYMTDGQRFHAFPRGVHEPWGEIASRQSLQLTVDRNLMFVYVMPYYLFVTPRQPELAKHIERGLLRAIDDGSFNELFFNNPMVQMVIAKANLTERRVFHLENPELPPKTPLSNPKLWIDLSAL